MRGLRFVMAHCVAGRPRRIDTAIALLLQLNESWGHTHIVDVAEHVLKDLQALDEALRIALVEQWCEEFRLVAEFFQSFSHLMTVLAVQLLEIAAELGGLLPRFAQHLARMSRDGFLEIRILGKRARPQGEVELQLRPRGSPQRGPDVITPMLPEETSVTRTSNQPV